MPDGGEGPAIHADYPQMFPQTVGQQVPYVQTGMDPTSFLKFSPFIVPYSQYMDFMQPPLPSAQPSPVPQPPESFDVSMLCAQVQELRKQLLELCSQDPQAAASQPPPLQVSFHLESFSCKEMYLDSWLGKWTAFFDQYGYSNAQCIGQIKIMLQHKAFTWWKDLRVKPTMWADFQLVFKAAFVSINKIDKF